MKYVSSATEGPPDPDECPEECQYYHPERIGGFCSFPPWKGVCFYDPENKKTKGE
jgi:hypothetical protein